LHARDRSRLCVLAGEDAIRAVVILASTGRRPSGPPCSPTRRIAGGFGRGYVGGCLWRRGGCYDHAVASPSSLGPSARAAQRMSSARMRIRHSRRSLSVRTRIPGAVTLDRSQAMPSRSKSALARITIAASRRDQALAKAIADTANRSMEDTGHRRIIGKRR